MLRAAEDEARQVLVVLSDQVRNPRRKKPARQTTGKETMSIELSTEQIRRLRVGCSPAMAASLDRIEAARMAPGPGAAAGSTEAERQQAREFIDRELPKIQAAASSPEAETFGPAKPWREILAELGVPCREAKQK